MRSALSVLVAVVGCLWLGVALYADFRGDVYRLALAPYVTVSAAVSAVLLAVLALPLLVPALRGCRLSPRAVAAIGGVAGALSLGVTVVIRDTASRPGSPVDRADAYTLFEIAVLVLALAVTVRRGAPRPAAVAALLLLAAVIARPVAVDVDEGSLIVTFFCTLIACGAGAWALTARLVVADRRRREERLRLEQRLAFARDLHDYVAHHVMGIVVQAQGAQVVAAARPEVVAPALAQIEQAGADALGALRRMVSGLRADDEAPVQAPPADLDRIRKLVTDFALPGTTACLVEDGPVAHLPPETLTVLHHVVMESLTNVRKHAAGARNVTVRLGAFPGHATADVTDDGTPDPGSSGSTDAITPAGGWGLTGLKERLASAGGTFRAGPDRRGEWRVSAQLPAPTPSPRTARP
ncbi:sensor histidine kinase [Kitasatospora sp. NBC_01539]|uniref:sensor histidine kinase n=1 Tax=Kitasatospora sp. NBC_01539 TaxID=2903577 RepID=UPI00386016F8